MNGGIKGPVRMALTQRVAGYERGERLPLPNNFLARGGENFGERGRFFIVKRHAPQGLSKPPLTMPINKMEATGREDNAIR